MITDEFIQLVETSLDSITIANVVPESMAYPTSGELFIRVTGDDTLFTMRQSSIDIIIRFSVICSIRTRKYVAQQKYIPYYVLLNLQERCCLQLLTDQAIQASIYSTIPGVKGVTGRMTTSRLNTRVQPVGPTFFNSEDNSSDRIAGFMLDQTYESPVVNIPIKCFQLPDDLQALVDG